MLSHKMMYRSAPKSFLDSEPARDAQLEQIPPPFSLRFIARFCDTARGERAPFSTELLAQ